MQEDIKQAVKYLYHGGIVIFPTDTAFGMGCRMDDVESVERLFKIRRRSEKKATPVLVADLEMARDYLLEVPDLVVRKLIKHYWPGALTIVLQSRTQKVPSLVRGGGDNLGVRMPDNDMLLEIIKQVGVPILGTSANFAGGKTPYKFEDLDPKLVAQVNFVVKGECKLKNASTVIDCTVMPWKLLRQGAITIKI